MTILLYSGRIILVYLFTYLVTRILTKKAIAEMTSYEVAGLMILANVAAEPLVDKVVVKSIYGSGFLVLLMVLISKLSIVNKFTDILEHTPTIVINKGKINMKDLKSLGLSLNQLLGLIRQQGYDKISDIEMAILEPQGNISVFAKAINKPVTINDLKISVPNKPISMPLILDGKIIQENLEYLERTEVWLVSELKKQGIENYGQQVAVAEIDSTWNLVVFRK